MTQAYLHEKRKEGTQHKCQKHNRIDKGHNRRSQSRQRTIKIVYVQVTNQKQNESSSWQHAAGQVERMELRSPFSNALIQTEHKKEGDENPAIEALHDDYDDPPPCWLNFIF